MIFQLKNFDSVKKILYSSWRIFIEKWMIKRERPLDLNGKICKGTGWILMENLEDQLTP